MIHQTYVVSKGKAAWLAVVLAAPEVRLYCGVCSLIDSHDLLIMSAEIQCVFYTFSQKFALWHLSKGFNWRSIDH